VKQIQKQKARKGIPDEELVLEEHPELKVITSNLACVLNSINSNWQLLHVIVMRFVRYNKPIFLLLKHLQPISFLIVANKSLEYNRK